MDTTKDPFLSDKAYNIAKRLVQVYLPAFGTFYAAVAAIWGLPASEAVVGTILALSTFIGLTVGVNSARYQPYTGDLIVEDGEDEHPFVWLNLNEIPRDFVDKDEILMRVKKTS